MAEKRVRVIMIIEIAGRPPEHVVETLKTHIGQMKNLKDIEYLSETFSEPKKIDEEKDLYTCFAEVEIETKNFERLVELVFDFMPSSVEVLEPAELNFDLQGATAFLNNLTGRLHRYDEIAKMAQIQNQQLARKLQVMEQEVIDKGKKVKKVKKKAVKKKGKKKN